MSLLLHINHSRWKRVKVSKNNVFLEIVAFTIQHLKCFLREPDSYPVAFRQQKRGDAEDFGKEMRGAQRVMGRTNSGKVARENTEDKETTDWFTHRVLLFSVIIPSFRFHRYVLKKNPNCC